MPLWHSLRTWPHLAYSKGRTLGILQDSGLADRGVEGPHLDLATELRGLEGGRIDVVDPEVDAPMRRRVLGGSVAAQGYHHSNDLPGNGLLGFAADVSGEAPQCDLAFPYIECVGLPAEHRAVEHLRALRITGVELAHGPCTRLIDELGAPMLTRLPHPEHRTLRIGDDRHAGDIAADGWLDNHAAARIGHLGDSVVGAIRPDVGVPRGHGRRAVAL